MWADSDDLSLEPQQSHCLFLSAPWSVGVYGVAVYACLHRRMEGPDPYAVSFDARDGRFSARAYLKRLDSVNAL